MAKPTFTEELLRLSNQIVTEEDLDCLRFIVTSKVGPDQHGKDAKGMLDHLVKEKFLSQNNIDILYEALTLMGRIRLRSHFLKKIGYRESYVPKRSVISTFTRMLIKVRHTLTVTGSELANLVYCYKNSEIGAGIVTCENSAYAVLQYLLDKVLVANDKESLDTFARFLGAATCVQGKQHVLKYLKDNPDLPQRAALQSTQEGSRHNVGDNSSDSADGGPEANIAGNNNIVLMDSQNVTINVVQGPGMFQQPGQQQPVGQVPAAGAQLGSQLAMDQPLLGHGHQATGQHSGMGQHSPMEQQPSTMQDGQLNRQDILPSVVQGPVMSQQQPVGQAPAAGAQLWSQPATDQPLPGHGHQATGQHSGTGQHSPMEQQPSTMQDGQLDRQDVLPSDGEPQPPNEVAGHTVISIPVDNIKDGECQASDAVEKERSEATVNIIKVVQGPVMSQQQPVGEAPAAGAQLWSQLATDQPLPGHGQQAIGQHPGTGQHPPMEQQPSTMQDGQLDRQDVLPSDTKASPTELSLPKPLSSLLPSGQPSTPPDDTPTSTDQLGFQQGSWCEEKKCFSFSQDEIGQMKGDKIGEGGFGIVHKGEWIKENGKDPVPVAIKIYNEEIAIRSGQGDKQFDKELGAVEISKHCFAITVLGYCRNGKYKAIVYPYMRKGDLRCLIDKHDPVLTWEIRVRILYQICHAMCHFHNSFGSRVGSAVVHGDVKDHNIFLDKHLNAFLGDFGVMEILPEDVTSITLKEKTNALGYDDPDAVKRLSVSSDVYMFGVVMYRCLTSKLAQQGDNQAVCKSLMSYRKGDIEATYEDLHEMVDWEIWTGQDELVKELAELAIKCFIMKNNKINKKRCTFKETLMKLGDLMKKKNIPRYEENADARCLCCQLDPVMECQNPECGCTSVMCFGCLQNKDLPCPFHLSDTIGANSSE